MARYTNYLAGTHNDAGLVKGGLGEACATAILENGLPLPFHVVGIPDEYTVTGSQSDIFRHYGISMEGLAATAQKVLARIIH